MINKLIQIISEEAALFEEFLELLDRQKDALVANDTESLNQTTELQQRKLMESQALNLRREEVIEAIQEMNRIDGDLTVTRLLEHVDRDQSERLSRLQETITGLNDDITEARNTNAMLLNRSREYIARTMAMLSRLSHPKNSNYDRTGAEPHGDATLAVDRRI